MRETADSRLHQMPVERPHSRTGFENNGAITSTRAMQMQAMRANAHQLAGSRMTTGKLAHRPVLMRTGDQKKGDNEHEHTNK